MQRDQNLSNSTRFKTEEEVKEYIRSQKYNRGIKVVEQSAPKAQNIKNDILYNYRTKGHLYAQINPLDNKDDGKKSYEFTDSVNSHETDIKYSDDQDLENKLNQVYCSTIGYEINHIKCNEKKKWLLNKIENVEWRNSIDKSDKEFIHDTLLKAEGFEQFLNLNFPGAKRFSAEGGESSLVLVQEIINQSILIGDIDDVTIGMPHRGRLNFLTNITKKPYSTMFALFQGKKESQLEYLNGDVKYHLGETAKYSFPNDKNVQVNILANPSHLEAINPVLHGVVKAKKDAGLNALAISLHGDAAFCGQGVVAEMINMHTIDGYEIGGTIRIIVNNQIGFTAAPNESRSSSYPSDIAKSLDIPVFHVNGDDPEAVLYVARIASEYKIKFKNDVIIDLVCYRKYGHNEGDEPSFTQPLMYKNIKSRKTTLAMYEIDLQEKNIFSKEEIESKKEAFNQILIEELKNTENFHGRTEDKYNLDKWKGFKLKTEESIDIPNTTISDEDYNYLANIIGNCEIDINANKKVINLMKGRGKVLLEGKNIDWGTGEALAFASILKDNMNVRVSGQDSKRGTFSHRHGVLVDQDNEEVYIPLQQISKGKLSIFSSPLSEYGVLGLEYGYSLYDPNQLVIWEAQFGDFSNGAQIIMDQFISSAEDKWGISSGVTLLLPHGYEGQGPEHSSARIERYLQLCAKDNMRVIVPTTPASLFHALRRQVSQELTHRKPLIVFTPKSLLRHKLAVSTKEDFINYNFEPVIFDVIAVNPKKLILCSGKIYYDIIAEREIRNLNEDIAMVRLEQLYPFPGEILMELFSQFNLDDIYICQEEPQNMGIWSFILENMRDIMIKMSNLKLHYIGRSKSASPATGYNSCHQSEQKEIIDKVLSISI